MSGITLPGMNRYRIRAEHIFEVVMQLDVEATTRLRKLIETDDAIEFLNRHHRGFESQPKTESIQMRDVEYKVTKVVTTTTVIEVPGNLQDAIRAFYSDHRNSVKLDGFSPDTVEVIVGRKIREGTKGRAPVVEVDEDPFDDEGGL